MDYELLMAIADSPPSVRAEIDRLRAAENVCGDGRCAQADRIEVLEREHAQFFDRWHEERRLNERLQPVLAAAVALVCAPAWAGISDEDVALEQALRDAGMVAPNE